MREVQREGEVWKKREVRKEREWSGGRRGGAGLVAERSKVEIGSPDDVRLGLAPERIGLDVQLPHHLQ